MGDSVVSLSPAGWGMLASVPGVLVVAVVESVVLSAAFCATRVSSTANDVTSDSTRALSAASSFAPAYAGPGPGAWYGKRFILLVNGRFQRADTIFSACAVIRIDKQYSNCYDQR